MAQGKKTGVIMLIDTDESAQAARDAAVASARALSASTGRKYVAREDHGVYNVCPLYRVNREGVEHDAVYTSLGALVTESM